MVMHIDNDASFKIQLHSSTASVTFILLAADFIIGDLRSEAFIKYVQ